MYPVHEKDKQAKSYVKPRHAMWSRLVSKRRDISLNDEIGFALLQGSLLKATQGAMHSGDYEEVVQRDREVAQQVEDPGAPGEITRGTALTIKRPRNVVLHRRNRKPSEHTNLHKMKLMQKQIV